MSGLRNYNWDADDYARHSGVQAQWADELISKLQLTGAQSILDIGCGDGKTTAKMAAHLPFGHVLGIDSSSTMIRLAGQNHPPTHHSNLGFEQHDALNFELPLKFDIIFSNAALHWIKNQKPVLACIYKALKPGGRIILQMGGHGNAADFIRVVEKIISRAPWGQYFKDFNFPYGFYEPGNYSKWMVEAGLSPSRVELIPKTMAYDTAHELAGWFRTTWLPYTSRIPNDRQDDFISQVIDSYVACYPKDENNKICVKMVRLEVEAHRS